MTNTLRDIYLSVHHTYRLEGNLRFELAYGADEDYLECIRKGKGRAKKLFDTIFSNQEKIQLVFFLPNNSGKIIMKRFLINGQYRMVDSFTTSAWNGYYEGFVTVTILEFSRKDLMVTKLIDSMMYRDFPTPGKLKLDYAIHFYNPSRQIILNIYDDRGCDIWSWDKKVLKSIFQEYQEWILDYDRKQIEAYYLEVLLQE